MIRLTALMMFIVSSVFAEEQTYSDEYHILKTFFPIEIDGYKRVVLKDYDDPRLGASVTLMRRSLRHVEELTVYLYNMGHEEITENDIESSFLDAVRLARRAKQIAIGDNGYYNLQKYEKECKHPIYFVDHEYSKEEIAQVHKSKTPTELKDLSGNTFILVGRSDNYLYKARFTFSGKKAEGHKNRYQLKDPLGMTLYFMKNMGDC